MFRTLGAEPQEPVMQAADADALKKRALLGGLAIGAVIGAGLMHVAMRRRHTSNRRKQRR
jgi:uncharacterized membrane protein (DUF441 family)